MESLPQNSNIEIKNEICPYCNMVLTENIFEDHIICHTIDILENNNQKYNINNYSENNSNSIIQNDKNIFDKLIDSFKNSMKQAENQNLNQQNIPTHKNSKTRTNNLLYRILNKIKNNNINDQNQRNNNINVRELYEALRNDTELREDPFHQEQPKLTKKEKNINTILNDLPVSTVTEKILKSSNNRNCAVCLANFNPGDEIISLPCFHIFHKDCVIDWLKYKLWCPVCKFKVSLRSLHREI